VSLANAPLQKYHVQIVNQKAAFIFHSENKGQKKGKKKIEQKRQFEDTKITEIIINDNSV